MRQFLRAAVPVLAILLGWALAAAGAAAQSGPEARVPRSGTTFLSPELQARQADDGANPGMLWVTKGEQLWSSAGPGVRACGSCHGDAAASMKGVAARYPAIDPFAGDLLNVEMRINRCRTRHMKTTELAWESDDLLALTTYVAHQSRGLPITVETGGPAASYVARGRAFFETRQGQLNLSCAQCHDQSVGRRLRGDVISQGHPTGYPIYRIEWQTAGSLHRRLRACSLGVRAEILPFGHADYVAVELYLAARASGLAIETPAIRR